jgi:type II secretory pathway pseudopilin PulG
MMFKIRPQIEYIDVAGNREIRILSYSDSRRLFVNAKMVFPYRSADDLPVIKEAMQEFLKTQKAFSTQFCDVILVTDKQFATSLLLPKVLRSKADIFVRNDLQDKFGDKYEEKFFCLTIPKKYHKDGLMNETYLIDKKVVSDVRKAVDALGLKVRDLCPISVLEAKAAVTDGSFSSNRVVLSLKDTYTLMNLYVSDVLADTFILPLSLNAYRKMNDKEKKDAMDSLYRKIISAIGRQEFGHAKGKTDFLVVRCEDKEVAEEVAKADPLELSYAAVAAAPVYYSHSFFDELPRNYQKDIFTAGYTMIEAVVSIAVLGIFVATVTGTVLGMNRLNTRTLTKEKASFYLDQVSERYQTTDEKKTVFGSSSDLSGNLVYVSFENGSYVASSEMPSAPLFRFTYTETSVAVGSKTSYSLTISDLKDTSDVTYIQSQVIRAVR